MGVHNNYLKLRDDERDFVDEMMGVIFYYRKTDHPQIKLAGDDRAEHVVEAIATWIMESQNGN